MGLVKEAKGGPTTYVKLRTGKEGVDPKVVKTEKVDGKWQETEEFHSVEGHLTNAKISYKDTDKWGRIYSLEILLTEPMEDNILIDAPLNFTTYPFINSILYCDTSQWVSIQPGYRKDKQGNLWKTIWFTDRDGKAIKWAYDMKELPPVEKVELRGKTQYNDQALIDFFTAKLEEKFNGTNPTEPSAINAPSDEPAKSDYPDDELPF